MENIRFPIGASADQLLKWIQSNWGGALEAIDTFMKWAVTSLTDLLLQPSALVMIIAFGIIGLIVRSWLFAIGTSVSFFLVVTMAQWTTTMQTLGLVLIAALIAVLIAVPLGILAARNRAVSLIMKPVLDFMQTMPAFVYLIPTVMFFSLGVVPGVISTILFALPPGVRFTELGIRGVDSETVEAGHAFGASNRQILGGIQLPLAVPTIMAGINQVIMLALSMAVVAGLAGANGLGKEVVQAISTMRLGPGIEAGLCVVILAVFLDRLTAAAGDPSGYPGSVIAIIRKARSNKRTGNGPLTPSATAESPDQAKLPVGAGV